MTTRSDRGEPRGARRPGSSSESRQQQVRVIRLGIELDERVQADEGARVETRRVLGVGQDAFVVGWVGRMTAVKQTDDVLRAFKGLIDRGVDA